MLCVKVEIKQAENAKRELLKKDLVSEKYKMFKEEGYFFIPVVKEIKGYEIVEKDVEERELASNFIDELKKELSREELEHLNTAFDVIGSIAVVEIDNELVKKEKLIAETLLKTNSKIKTVVKKVGEHKGEFRVQDYKYLAGVENFETLHKESDVVLKLDIRKTYFSPRSAAERLRICSQIKKGEDVLVMFSGVGIYPFVFSKHSEARKIVGVEINPDACRFALESLKLNKKIKNVELYCVDVREHFRDKTEKFDRIVMPLPKTASDFLDVVQKLVKKGTIVHFYFFDKQGVILDNSSLKDLFSRYFERFNILRIVKAGQQSPRVFRLCADVEIL